MQNTTPSPIPPPVTVSISVHLSAHLSRVFSQHSLPRVLVQACPQNWGCTSFPDMTAQKFRSPTHCSVAGIGHCTWACTLSIQSPCFPCSHGACEAKVVTILSSVIGKFLTSNASSSHPNPKRRGNSRIPSIPLPLKVLSQHCTNASPVNLRCDQNIIHAKPRHKPPHPHDKLPHSVH